MTKRILKILAFILALGLIAWVCVIVNSLVGNPISKAIAKNTTKNHIAENYTDKNFEIERVTYSFKDGYYHSFVSSPGSIDSHFTVVVDMWGNLRYDTYDDRVLGGWNTASRISEDYRKSVDAVLDSPSFPYNEHIGYGDFEFYPREHIENYPTPDYAIIIEDLIPDAVYDVNSLGEKHGKLTIYVDNETVSVDKLSGMLLDIRRIFDAAGVKFYVIDFVLEYPKSEDGQRKEGRVEVMDFLYSDIYEEGMTERVKASNEAARNYYTEQDSEKLEEKSE